MRHCLALVVATLASSWSHVSIADSAPSGLPSGDIVEAPTYAVGDWWATRLESGRIKTRRIETINPDMSVVTIDTSGTRLSLSNELNRIHGPGANGFVTYRPHNYAYAYPLFPGKQWDETASWSNSFGTTGSFRVKGHVIGWEEITVTLLDGSVKQFRALRVERELKNTYEGLPEKSTCWYAREAKAYVRCTDDFAFSFADWGTAAGSALNQK